MNRFFTSSVLQAYALHNRYARMAMLLAKITAKISQTNWRQVKGGTMRRALNVLVRMAGAYVRGQYRVIPWKTMVTLLAALIYFLNPLDVVPDFLPAIGLVDDFAVLMCVYQALAQEVNRFLAWEKAAA
jgi:uncharacterized membrane protein YkvA (DUF1232 family)